MDGWLAGRAAARSLLHLEASHTAALSVLPVSTTLSAGPDAGERGNCYCQTKFDNSTFPLIPQTHKKWVVPIYALLRTVRMEWGQLAIQSPGAVIGENIRNASLYPKGSMGKQS